MAQTSQPEHRRREEASREDLSGGEGKRQQVETEQSAPAESGQLPTPQISTGQQPDAQGIPRPSSGPKVPVLGEML